MRPLGIEVGPTFVRLKVEPKDDTDFAKVKRQADNLKMQLGVEYRPLLATQAGFLSLQGALGIEKITWGKNGWLGSAFVFAVEADGLRSRTI